MNDRYNSLLELIRVSDYEKTTCLRFIDPYGDTTFNHIQAIQLLIELKELHKIPMTSDDSELLAEIEKLVIECKDGQHLYIKMYGD